MPIPTTPRVEYGRNTLAEVVCQLRFPPILKIESAPPANFQERIRADYPLYAEKGSEALGIALPSGIPSDISKLLNSPSSFEFSDSEKTWRVSLTREFVALTCSSYSRWEDFRQKLTKILEALVAEYNPAFFSRIGLRYRNVITRSQLGLNDVPWSELLNAWAIGELSRDELSAEVEQASRDVVVRLDRFDGRVKIQHGLAEQEPPTGEVSYLIDCDYFARNKTEVSDAQAVLDFLNQQSGCLFRWYVQERLHTAMEPHAL